MKGSDLIVAFFLSDGAASTAVNPTLWTADSAESVDHEVAWLAFWMAEEGNLHLFRSADHWDTSSTTKRVFGAESTGIFGVSNTVLPGDWTDASVASFGLWIAEESVLVFVSSALKWDTCRAGVAVFSAESAGVLGAADAVLPGDWTGACVAGSWSWVAEGTVEFFVTGAA